MVLHFLRQLRRGAVSPGGLLRRAASPAASSLRSQAFPWVHGVLFAPASSAEFLSNKPPPRRGKRSRGRFVVGRNYFCWAPLAQSLADCAHLHRGSHHGLVLCAGSKHVFARAWTM